MPFAPHDSLCADFCIVLGLDPKMVRKIVLTMEPEDVVTFEAQIYPSKDGIRGVGEIITKRCKIVPIAEPVEVIGAEYIEYQKEEG